MHFLRMAAILVLTTLQSYALAADLEESPLEQRYREQHEKLEFAYTRFEHELLGEEAHSNPNATAQLKDARLAWQDYSNKFCSLMSSVYGGHRGFLELECKIDQEKLFEQTLKSYGW